MTRVWCETRTAVMCVAAMIAPAMTVPALAQDEERAVPVDKAPYHQPVFSNEHVLVMKIDIPPQRNTGYHTHVRDSVSVNIVPADMVTQDVGQTSTAPAPRRKPGEASFNAYGKEHRTHKNSNVGPTPFHNVSFIFRSPAPLGLTPSSRTEVPVYARVMDNDRVRGWRLVLEPGASVAAITQQAPGLRVVVGGGEIVERVPGQPDRSMNLRVGEFYWQDSGLTRSVRNAGPTRIELLEFELK
ncbi:MAG: hypothetical protein EXQ59_03430 [Acidobacteria bacterium]|nr:hypothetical protein [Acidobacteriota bacterium]